MAREKLTDDKIAIMEEWADKKKNTAMSEAEKTAVEAIDSLRKSNWKGYRVEHQPVTAEEAKANLERLKKRKI